MQKAKSKKGIKEGTACRAAAAQIWSLSPASEQIWSLSPGTRDSVAELPMDREPVTKFANRVDE